MVNGRLQGFAAELTAHPMKVPDLILMAALLQTRAIILASISSARGVSSSSKSSTKTRNADTGSRPVNKVGIPLTKNIPRPKAST